MIIVEAIDLCCGIGGLSYGLKKSGIAIKAGLDNDKSCRLIYEKNIGSEYIEADITKYDFEKLKSYYSDKAIKVLVGCPPCQPFSSLSYKNKNFDARRGLIFYFQDAIKVVKPDIVILENVRGFYKSFQFKSFVSYLKQRGYFINYEIVFCPNYGIPQNRYRLIMFGSLKNQLTLISKTYSQVSYRTVRNFIEGLRPLSAGSIDTDDKFHRCQNLSDLNLERINKSRPGGNWWDWDKSLLPDCYKKESGKTYTSVYGRMEWDAPSPTITTQFCNYGSGRFGHPDQDRALSIREGALLQTFPMTYDFVHFSSITKLCKGIGNAVPPVLGEVIGISLLEHINKYF